MNEMKPEDVMRALECCVDTKDLMACQDCPYYGNEYCVHRLNTDALALLREKDAQISALQYQADFWDKHARVLDETISIQQKEIAEKDAEIERLNKEVDRLSQVVLYHDAFANDAMADARAEAITEFAERLKEHFSCHDGVWYGAVSYEEIDQIAKEMKEGNGDA